jgi:TfoX/Sxy family transcriptional regulator of competence genes
LKLPKADEKLEVFFRLIVPEDPAISVRPMFGNLAAFVHGNLFAGLFGDTLFVRLSEKDRANLLEEKGAKLFAPMAGRPMKEYVCLPGEWLGKPATVGPWISRSLELTKELPPKAKKRGTKK